MKQFAHTVILACAFVVSNEALADQPRVLSDYMSTDYVGVSLVNPALPVQALRQQDVDRWVRMLNASEAQSQFMQLHYNQFVKSHNEYMDSQLKAYIAQSSALVSASTSGGYDDAYVDEMRSLRSTSMRICRELAQLEHDFIDALKPILTDDQRDQLEILRLEGTRRSFRTFSNHVRWADVELRQMWGATDIDVDFAIEATVQEILAEYESQLTSLVQVQAQAHSDRPIQIIPLLIRYRSGMVSDSGFTASYRRIHGRFLNAGLAIRALTETTLEQLQQTLPPSAAQALARQVKQHVYPELYPDPTKLHQLFEAVLGAEDLKAQWLNYLEPMLADYQDRYAQICDRMEALCIEWSDKGQLGEPDYHDADFPAALEPLLNDRRALAVTTLQSLNDIVGEEFLESYVHLIPSSLFAALQEQSP